MKKNYKQRGRRRLHPGILKRSLSLHQTDSQHGGQQDTKAFPDLPPLKLITTLARLPLSDFIDCCVSGTYSALVVSGTPTGEQLHDAWLRLVTDYNEIVNPTGSRKDLSLSITIEQLNMKIVVVESLVNALRVQFNDVLVSELQSWGYTITTSPEDLPKCLKRIETELGNDKTTLSLARTDYERGKPIDAKTTPREKFVKILLSIGEHRRQHYRETDLSTYEFALMYKQLLDHCEHLEKQKKNSHGR